MLVFRPAVTEHRSWGLITKNLLSFFVTLQSWGCKRKWLSSACWFSAYKWLVWLNLYCELFWGFFFKYTHFCVVWVSWKPLQIDMTSGIILEETYRKWIQYKDDCIKMIETEPLSTRNLFHLMLKAATRFCQAHLLPDIYQFPLWFLTTGGLFCNRTFDRYACWPDAPAGSLINISCPFYLPWFDKGKY